MTYLVTTSPRARRDLKSIPPNFMDQIDSKINLLSTVPRPHGCEKLEGNHLFRVRLGDYRIVYHVDDKVLSVTVVHVGHRREVYRNL
ncbi:MAG: type II toxin-antitoxin system RelE/ParE family toxin [Chlamydiae bacterium]|nr:type II toxin-antitoxin system RelE/ParE family toxin [Chlamydiota bacterium]MBI3265647.1 type II toxin-antitoxin system RelE/ParE family toxin [Chlamydiota bacterium]